MDHSFHKVALEQLSGLLGYAMALTANKAEAEDLVQETYLRATQAYQRLAPGSHIKSWLHTILRNAFLNQRRSHRSNPPLVEMEDESGVPLPMADEDSPDPLVSYLSEEKIRDVRHAIDSLPDSLREVIILREYQELSYREMAEVLQCPMGTVMSRLGRARDKLRYLLEHLKEETARS